MPQHKSCEKRVRTNEKRALANRRAMSEIRTLTRKMQGVTGADEGKKIFHDLSSKLDKAARKNRLHANQVARRKSRAQKILNKLEG